MENNSTRLNYKDEKERDRDWNGRWWMLVRGAFVRKDYGGRFKPLQRSDATEFHLLSMRGESTTFASLIKYLLQDTTIKMSYREIQFHTFELHVRLGMQLPIARLIGAF